MTERLLVRLTVDGALHWRGAGAGMSGVGAPPAALLAAARQIVVLVPGADVLLTETDLPRGSATRLAKVLPFALEDHVLDPVDTLHFALGPPLAGARYAAAVVSRARLEAWLAQLREAGIVADVMVPDTLALPLRADAATVLVEDTQCLVRLMACGGFACDSGQLAVRLAMVPELRALIVYPADRDALPGMPGEIPIDRQPSADALETLARGIGDAPALNLLQGELAPRHRRAPQRRLWRIAAALAVVAALLALVGQALDVARLHAANDRVDAAIAQIYAQTFSKSPIAADPVARMHSELQRLRGGAHDDGLLLTLARIAPVLRQHNRQLVTLGIEYRNATLELSVRAPDLASLDQLREQLATLPGVQVQLTAATPGDDGVEGRLRIRGGGA